MFENPEVGFRIMIWLSWALVVMGVLKMGIWIIGAVFPKAYDGIQSPGLKRFMTGNGNHLLFGLGGFLTALLGGIFLGIIFLLQNAFADRL